MKFQKLTRGGSEYRIYADNCGGIYSIHGAMRIGFSVWHPLSWTADGKVNVGGECDGDLLPEKKRRFKTAQELVNCYYGEVSFYSNNRIIVKHLGEMWSKVWSDTPEGNYPEKWLNVFTTWEDE